MKEKSGLVLVAFLTVFVSISHLWAGEFRQSEDEKGNLVLENSRISIVLEPKTSNYHINAFYNKKGLPDNMIAYLLFRICQTPPPEGKEVQYYEYSKKYVKSSEPELIEEENKLTFSVLQTWPMAKVKKIVRLFSGKPYFQLRFEIEFTKDFDARRINVAPYVVQGEFFKYLSYETPSGVNTVAHKGEREWFRIPFSFAKGGWIAVHSKESEEGVSILFPNLHLWNDFRTTYRKYFSACSEKGGGFMVSCRHPRPSPGNVLPAGEKRSKLALERLISF